MLRKVILNGELAEEFGRDHELFAKRPADIFRYLESNFPGFRTKLVSYTTSGVGLHISYQDRDLDEADLGLSLPEGTIEITPIPAGADSGEAKILAAVAIFAFILFPPGGGPALFKAGLTGWKAAALSVATAVATNLAITGIQQLMAPDPATEDQDDSYLFNGPEQNIIKGDPVPLLYGQLRVPGQPISFEVVNDTSVTSGDYTSSFSNAGIVGGIEGLIHTHLH